MSLKESDARQAILDMFKSWGDTQTKGLDARPWLSEMLKMVRDLHILVEANPDSFEGAMLQLVQETDQPQDVRNLCEMYLRVFVERRKGTPSGRAIDIALKSLGGIKTH